MSAKTPAAAMRRVARKLQQVSETLMEQDDHGADAQAWRWAIDARVSRRAALLNAAIAKAGAMYLPERLHQVRIALKKMRYGVELASDAGASKLAPDLATLSRVQTLLGRMHDLQVLIDHVRRVQAEHAGRDFTASRELDALILALERSCRRLHARYVRERTPLAAICDRLAAKPTRRAGEAGAARPVTERRAG